MVESVFGAGAKLLHGAAKASKPTRNFLKQVLVSMVLEIQVANASSRTFRSVEIGAEALSHAGPRFRARAVARLEEQGVVFVRLVDAAGVETYSAVYKGETIVPPSKAQELRKELRKTWNKKGDDLVRELKKIADGNTNSNFSIINSKVQKYWTKFLTKKGVRFEIGTEYANKLLDESSASGLFISRGYNFETNTYAERIIYLRKNPSTSTFLEETYHALQSLAHLQKYVDIIHEVNLYKQVDNWEYLAKKRILDEAQHNKITYEEYILTEKQLFEVLKNEY